MLKESLEKLLEEERRKNKQAIEEALEVSNSVQH